MKLTITKSLSLLLFFPGSALGARVVSADLENIHLEGGMAISVVVSETASADGRMPADLLKSKMRTAVDSDVSRNKTRGRARSSTIVALDEVGIADTTDKEERANSAALAGWESAVFSSEVQQYYDACTAYNAFAEYEARKMLREIAASATHPCACNAMYFLASSLHTGDRMFANALIKARQEAEFEAALRLYQAEGLSIGTDEYRKSVEQGRYMLVRMICNPQHPGHKEALKLLPPKEEL